ncbi:MAG: carbamate kinase [Oscillospiraceae bacterium]|nr:carbamate kinase [Oscillospiraceae bacterium]MCL2277871.1 carbamate kinase [Oscillospiraceae bacterium]
MKRIVLALGGNALGDNLHEQMKAIKSASMAIADLIEDGLEVVITHGNGPQVGMINLAMETAQKVDESLFYIPMSVCVAMSQGYIGYDIQNALREELLRRNIQKPVATIITQTLVDADDPAFLNPSKPIGAFYSESEAIEMISRGYDMKEDAGRGWRRVVASPKPVGIVESDTVLALLRVGQIPVAVGGGGIPVKKVTNRQLKGTSAVVDKDFASAKLAEELDADMLVILTAVEKVAINYGKPDEKWLSELSSEDAERYISEGHFAPGSMLPKVEAALLFAKSGSGRKALITKLETARDGLAGKTGTVITGR